MVTLDDLYPDEGDAYNVFDLQPFEPGMMYRGKTFACLFDTLVSRKDNCVSIRSDLNPAKATINELTREVLAVIIMQVGMVGHWAAISVILSVNNQTIRGEYFDSMVEGRTQRYKEHTSQFERMLNPKIRLMEKRSQPIGKVNLMRFEWSPILNINQTNGFSCGPYTSQYVQNKWYGG